MPVSIESLGIDRLSVRDRLDLIEQIWDRLPEQVNPMRCPHGIWRKLPSGAGGGDLPRGR